MTKREQLPSREELNKRAQLVRHVRQLDELRAQYEAELIDLDTFWCEAEVIVDHARGVQTGAE